MNLSEKLCEVIHEPSCRSWRVTTKLENEMTEHWCNGKLYACHEDNATALADSGEERIVEEIQEGQK